MTCERQGAVTNARRSVERKLESRDNIRRTEKVLENQKENEVENCGQHRKR